MVNCLHLTPTKLDATKKAKEVKNVCKASVFCQNVYIVPRQRAVELQSWFLRDLTRQWRDGEKLEQKCLWKSGPRKYSRALNIVFSNMDQQVCQFW